MHANLATYIYIILLLCLMKLMVAYVLGTWERDMNSGSAVETVKFIYRNETENVERLELYEEHMAYGILTYVC